MASMPTRAEIARAIEQGRCAGAHEVEVAKGENKVRFVLKRSKKEITDLDYNYDYREA